MASYSNPGTNFDLKKLKLYEQYGGQQKYLAAKKALDNAKKQAAKDSKPLLNSNKVILDELNDPVNGYYARLKLAQLENNAVDIAFWKTKITKARAKIKENNLKIYVIEVKLKDAQDKFNKAKIKSTTGSGSGSGADTVTSNTPGTGPWHFNAPLVKRADFVYTTTSSVNEGTESRRDVTITRTNQIVVPLPKLIPAGTSSVDDAYNFWTNQEYGKGAIQMDRKTNTIELAANAKKEAALNKIKFDDKMYGFRFNYNPTTVNMSWGAIAGANPVYESAGKDPAAPMAQNLISSYLTFDIILNRIQDLALLNSSGKYLYGENPYPWEISAEDRKMIVNKGTMYDLEYLFRTMHGYAFYSNFSSTLMGKTNDPGWLPVRPVELHLGNKLRYRVRISGLEVVHKIFSAKMVPLLSVVSITCMRYWDGPNAKDYKKAT
jgi:hypothetical protein